MLRSFLLAPCLLICLACATPFPLDNLEEGMTYETVRENFGEPEAFGVDPPFDASAGTFWTYVHEEQDWFLTFHPFVQLFSLVLRFIPPSPEVYDRWNFGYVNGMPVVLHFEDEKLAHWEVIRPAPVVSSGYDALGALRQQQQQQRMWQQMKDIKHHKEGHTHHHVDHDGC